MKKVERNSIKRKRIKFILSDKNFRQNDGRIKQNDYIMQHNRVIKRRNMAQVSMTVRMDSNIKAQFEALCNQFGMSVNTAMNIFANAVVRKRKIPFEIDANSSENQVLNDFYAFRRELAASNRPELTMEEINEEIRLAREEMMGKKKSEI